MQNEPRKVTEEYAIQLKLLLLLERFNVELKEVGVNLETFASRYADWVTSNDKKRSHRYADIKNNAEKWINGDTLKIQERTARELKSFFSPAIPQLGWRWFRSEVNILEFEENCNRTSQRGLKLFLESRHSVYSDHDMNRWRKQVVGVYVTYRFGFENSGKLVKEILHIYKQGPFVKARYYFCSDRKIPANLSELEFFDCQGFPSGNSFVFFGLHSNSEFLSRTRTLIVGKEETGAGFPVEWQFGLLMSFSAQLNCPGAARVAMSKQVLDIEGSKVPQFALDHLSFLWPEEFDREGVNNSPLILETIGNSLNQYGEEDYVLLARTDKYNQQIMRGRSANKS